MDLETIHNIEHILFRGIQFINIEIISKIRQYEIEANFLFQTQKKVGEFFKSFCDDIVPRLGWNVFIMCFKMSTKKI